MNEPRPSATPRSDAAQPTFCRYVQPWRVEYAGAASAWIGWGHTLAYLWVGETAHHTAWTVSLWRPLPGSLLAVGRPVQGQQPDGEVAQAEAERIALRLMYLCGDHCS